MNALQIDNLSLDIAGNNILRGINADMQPGELVGLIGPNGAGKTSLLKCMLGLVDAREGKVTLDGKDIWSLEPRERARAISYAAQGAPVHWPLSVEYVVGLGRLPHLNPWQRIGEADQKLIDRSMELTDCAHLKDRSTTTLSGGERARVLLARVLAADTPVILADEPVASLDPAHQLQVMDILRSQAREGKAVTVVLHDLGLAQRYCDRLVLLDGGKLIGQGTPDDILSDQNLADVFGVAVHRWSEDGEDLLVTRQLSGGER